ncbi:class I SAM-dependent methyltransferase [Streptacidiphilus sp. MAP5-52]|uniref:class I SAM-dependent methyltransferase n=1 Tax=Streptacidiphilus sp. MAP5-52 TaxID=3156267 RepID=UPI0035169015
MSSLFRSAAPAYRAHRPGVPAPVADLLASTVTDAAWPALLDLGTGTGQVPAALHPYVSRIDLVDPDPGMLAEAQAHLLPLIGDTPLRTHLGPAEELTAPEPGYRADLVTACRSWHWVDQPRTLALLDTMTAPTATVAIMGDGSLWTADSDWTRALRTLIQSYLGTERRAGSDGTYRPPRRPYAQVLAESAFSDITEHTLATPRTWTRDQVLGYLASSSFARPDLFGDRHSSFEEHARTLLDGYPVLAEDAVFTVLLARRPRI